MDVVYCLEEDVIGVILINRIFDIFFLEVNVKIIIYWIKDRFIFVCIIVLLGKFFVLSLFNLISYINIVYFSLFLFKF